MPMPSKASIPGGEVNEAFPSGKPHGTPLDNPTLRAIRERRSVNTFGPQPVAQEQLEAILEAGRWAPSAHNSQPCDFVVVTDPATRYEISSLLRLQALVWVGFANAPVMLVVCVDPSRDSTHFVEDGAIAAQNLCLAAQSLGLASSWAGVYPGPAEKSKVEGGLKKLLGLPRGYRIIAVVPVGTAIHLRRGQRRPLADMVHLNRFQVRPKPTKGPADRQE
jgi:nitroreductase